MAFEISNTCIALHGFTTVQRRHSTVNTRHFHGEQEKEWTAARCHRLLRALTSRVAILNKDITRLAQARRGAPQSNVAPPKSVKTTRSAWDQDEGEWAQPKKKVKRTYSSRRGRNAAGREVPKTPRMSGIAKGRKSIGRGEILVPTPILARARGETYMDDHPSIIANAGLPEVEVGRVKRSKKQCTTNDGESCFQLSGTLRDMRQKTNASRYTIYEGIYNGLEAILRSTMNNEPDKRRKGARSLFSTALRVVPDYILAEEAYVERTATKSAINTRDISMEIYDELEAFGSSGQGWKQLKVIVRSHGIQVLRDAITEGLLDIEFCGVLITLCIHTFATEEAEVLLGALLSSNRVSAPKTLYDHAPRSFSMLWKFVEYTGRFSFQYRQLAKLVSEEVLPLGWLAAKEFRSVWTGVMQRLSPDSVNLDALNFLQTSLPMLAGSREATNCFNVAAVATVKHTFSSMLTTLLSIVILSWGTTDLHRLDSEESFTSYKHLTSVLQSSVVQYRLSLASNSQGALLHIANLIIKEQLDADTEGFLVELLREDNDDDLDDTHTSYDELVAYVCSVACCCGRGASTKGFEYLEYLHRIIERVSADSILVEVFQGVIVDSAFAYAQQLPEPIHIEYASAMDTRFSGRNVKRTMNAISEADNDARPGFRWEEGIGEWVTATPGNKSKLSTNTDYPAVEEVEIDSPFSAPPSEHQDNGLQQAPLAKKRSLRSANMFVEPEEDPEMYEDSDPIVESQHSEEESAESDDELHTSFSQREDSFQSDESGSDSEMEASSIEASFYAEVSPTKSEFADASRGIDRAPWLGRRSLQKSQSRSFSDESFNSTVSSTPSQSRESEGGRQFIDRAPRLGRKALRSSQAWKLFDESDDELSFCSVSSQEQSLLQDITSTSNTTNTRPLRKPKVATKQRRPICNAIDSEDELGI